MADASVGVEPELEAGKPLDTPRKNKILGYIKCCEDHQIKWTKVAVARALKVSRMQVDYAIKHPYPRTKKNSEAKHNNARKITSEDLDAVQRHIDAIDFSDGHKLNWNDVVTELGLDVTPRHLGELMKPRLRRSKIKVITPRSRKKVSTEQPSTEQPSQQQPLPQQSSQQNQSSQQQQLSRQQQQRQEQELSQRQQPSQPSQPSQQQQRQQPSQQQPSQEEESDEEEVLTISFGSNQRHERVIGF